MDYRDIDEKFDHVVSLGMFEHVGHKNYRTYMEKISSILKDDGLFLLHTIGSNKSVVATDPWIEKYIFPNSMLPSAKQITTAYEKLFVMEDWHSFGHDYDTTLMHWYKNFSDNWDYLKENYDERFCRMWKYYLLVSAGSFRARKNQLWQIVFSKEGVRGGYKSLR
jgi:cyclopropane-fatty-acyl-phospholipid synthase